MKASFMTLLLGLMCFPQLGLAQPGHGPNSRIRIHFRANPNHMNPEAAPGLQRAMASHGMVEQAELDRLNNLPTAGAVENILTNHLHSHWNQVQRVIGTYDGCGTFAYRPFEMDHEHSAHDQWLFRESNARTQCTHPMLFMVNVQYRPNGQHKINVYVKRQGQNTIDTHIIDHRGNLTSHLEENADVIDNRQRNSESSEAVDYYMNHPLSPDGTLLY